MSGPRATLSAPAMRELLAADGWTVEALNAELRSAVAYGHSVGTSKGLYQPNDDGSVWTRQEDPPEETEESRFWRGVTVGKVGGRIIG